jgi:hypothetical protein
MPGAYQSIAPTAAGMTFGIELSEQVVSEGTEVPKVVEKCAEAIEAYGRPDCQRTKKSYLIFTTDRTRSDGYISTERYHLKGSKVERSVRYRCVTSDH